MSDHPLLLLLLTTVGIYIVKLWRDDLMHAAAGRPQPNALPGATGTPTRAIVVAVLGALGLLALETWGEIRLGLVDEQSEMTALFGLYTLSAAFIEEIIFRGYIVVTKRGPLVQWLAIVGASALFALLHPFLWAWEDEFTLTLTAKGMFSTTMAFLFSLWFYATRFMRLNPARSLLPCFAAHLAKNAGVIVIKGAQGFLVGWW
ncbi:MAG: CPBP family intramembrane metalloprotease [Opitutaceae bacterium]|nr:CPBP family intramembrane metalloprotease [Opitutaceae bacterium]